MEATGSVSARGSRSIAGAAAVAGITLAAVLAAWGTFGDDENPQVRDYLVVLAIIGVAALVVFGWIVPRALRKESAGVTALVLSGLAVITIGAFWSGLPPVLAAGGIAVGVAGWNARTGAGLCRAGVVIGLFALVGDVLVYVGDMT